MYSMFRRGDSLLDALCISVVGRVTPGHSCIMDAGALLASGDVARVGGLVLMAVKEKQARAFRRFSDQAWQTSAHILRQNMTAGAFKRTLHPLGSMFENGAQKKLSVNL